MSPVSRTILCGSQCTPSCTQPGATVPCIIINRISHLITHVLIQSMSDLFLYLWTRTAKNSGYKRQFWVKSRIVPAEYDNMTGLGVLPAGLFLCLGEKTIRKSSLQQTEMHPLWTIISKRPEYRRIVHSMNHSDWCI